MKYDVVNLENNSVGSIELADDVFSTEIKESVLARVIQWQLDKRRAGTHKTKDVGEVSGNGTKPHKQKGSGRARLGQVRAPHTRHGGVVFGPVVRSHAYKLNKKIRALGMRIALSLKAKNGQLVILDDMSVKTPKTKEMQAIFAKNNWKSVLFVGGETVNDHFALAVRNIPNADVLPAQGANVYDIIRRNTLVLSKEAVSVLEGRLK